MTTYNEKKLSVNSVKQRHKELVINSLLKGNANTRTQIARVLAISNATVGTIIEELSSVGLVSETSDNTAGIGRRPKIIKLNSNSILTMVIDLSIANTLLYTIMNVEGKAIVSDSFTNSDSYENTLNHLLSCAKQFMDTRNLTAFLSGICVSIPGIYRKDTDTITLCTISELCNIQIAKTIGYYFDVDIYVENDINLATRSYLVTEELSYPNMVFVYIGDGIGSSIIINGNLFEGSHGFGGEIGQTIIDENSTLEKRASAKLLFKNIKQKYNTNNIEEAKIALVKKYYEDDIYIQDKISDITNALSFSIANIIVTINPNIIYIAGHLNMLGEKFINELQQKIHYKIPQFLKENTLIEYANTNTLSIEVGANSIIIENWVKQISSQ